MTPFRPGQTPETDQGLGYPVGKVQLFGQSQYLEHLDRGALAWRQVLESRDEGQRIVSFAIAASAGSGSGSIQVVSGSTVRFSPSGV